MDPGSSDPCCLRSTGIPLGGMDSSFLADNFLWVPCPCLPALRALVHASLTSTCHTACRCLRTFSGWRGPPCPPRRQAGPSGNYRTQGTVLNCSPMRPGARALPRLSDSSVTHVFHGGFQAPLAELSFNNPCGDLLNAIPYRLPSFPVLLPVPFSSPPK